MNRLADLRKPELISPPEPAEPIAVERSAQPLPGTRPGNEITVDYAIGHRVQRAWTPVHNTGIRVAEQVSVRSADELITVRATAVYSDGSTADKQVAWDTEGIDFTVPGTYTVHGKVVTHDLPFPLASGYADPVILLGTAGIISLPPMIMLVISASMSAWQIPCWAYSPLASKKPLFWI